jgi:intermembrane space import and assembly protein 40
MQDCFRQYPEVYGAELDDDDDEPAPAGAPGSEQPLAAEVDASTSPDEKHEHAKEAREQVNSAVAEHGERSESEEIIPKASHESETEKKPEEQTEK